MATDQSGMQEQEGPQDPEAAQAEELQALQRELHERFPSVEVPIDVFRGVFNPNLYPPLEFPNCIPADIRSLSPYVERFRQIGRMGAYPDAFRLDRYGTPRDTVFLHVLRLAAQVTEVVNRSEAVVRRNAGTPAYARYLLDAHPFSLHGLLSLAAVHDLGELELVTNENEDLWTSTTDVDYQQWLQEQYLQRCERSVPPPVWDQVTALLKYAEETSPDSRPVRERRAIEEILSRTDLRHLLCYHDEYVRAKHWLNGDYHSPVYAFGRETMFVNAALLKILDFCDGNIVFHTLLAEYLKEGHPIDTIDPLALGYTFDRTQVYLDSIRSAHSLSREKERIWRRIYIALLYEQIRHINECWKHTGGTPYTVNDALGSIAETFSTLISVRDWTQGTVEI